jgi:hypothetical protein
LDETLTANAVAGAATNTTLAAAAAISVFNELSKLPHRQLPDAAWLAHGI